MHRLLLAWWVGLLGECRASRGSKSNGLFSVTQAIFLCHNFLTGAQNNDGLAWTTKRGLQSAKAPTGRDVRPLEVVSRLPEAPQRQPGQQSRSLHFLLISCTVAKQTDRVLHKESNLKMLHHSSHPILFKWNNEYSRNLFLYIIRITHLFYAHLQS